jgi:hypothetical protein
MFENLKTKLLCVSQWTEREIYFFLHSANKIDTVCYM